MWRGSRGFGSWHIYLREQIVVQLWFWFKKVSFSDHQKAALEKFWSKMGYRMFNGIHPRYVSHGWPKGVITFVLCSLRSSFVHLHGHAHGALLAVEVGGVLFLNSYSSPDFGGEFQHEQAALVEETNGGCQLAGPSRFRWWLQWILGLFMDQHCSFHASFEVCFSAYWCNTMGGKQGPRISFWRRRMLKPSRTLMQLRFLITRLSDYTSVRILFVRRSWSLKVANISQGRPGSVKKSGKSFSKELVEQ